MPNGRHPENSKYGVGSGKGHEEAVGKAPKQTDYAALVQYLQGGETLICMGQRSPQVYSVLPFRHSVYLRSNPVIEQ